MVLPTAYHRDIEPGLPRSPVLSVPRRIGSCAGRTRSAGELDDLSVRAMLLIWRKHAGRRSIVYVIVW
jgi:hypothetical protein